MNNYCAFYEAAVDSCMTGTFVHAIASTANTAVRIASHLLTT
jgi:hypothetical protein